MTTHKSEERTDSLQAQLRALCERHKGVTPGEWYVEESDGYITGHITSTKHTYSGNLKSRADSICDPNSLTAADAAAIADLPTMLALLRSAADALDAAQANDARWRWWHERGMKWFEEDGDGLAGMAFSCQIQLGVIDSASSGELMSMIADYCIARSAPIDAAKG